MNKADDDRSQNSIRQNDFFERPKSVYEQFMEARFERKNRSSDNLILKVQKNSIQALCNPLGKIKFFSKGCKVKFISSNKSQVEWGNNDDPDLLLEKDKIYEVKNIEVYSNHMKLYLKEIDGKFNSVSFEVV